jgi:uncharacterized protein (DUF1800 family)
MKRIFSKILYPTTRRALEHVMSSIERNTPLDSIDPQWAWQTWEPSEAEAWDVRRVALLYRRAAFCASQSTIQSALSQSPQEVVDSLLSPKGEAQVALAKFEAESKTLANAVRASGEAKQLSTWWLHRMLNSPQPLTEKLTLFWHGHFATGAEKVIDVELMLEQNQFLRQHSLGDFKAMVHGIAKDAAMLIYLDSVTNRKAHANENFARELMELFCLGEGNYSEHDVQELARCFTGWEIRRKQFRFNAYQHDNGTKSILGKQVSTGEEAIDQVLASKDLPYFIAGKLFRFFVSDEPTPSRELLEPLARKFSEDNLSLQGLMRTILGSRLLLSDWSLGRKVRSPVELSIGLLRTLEGTTNLYQLTERLREVGQAVFFPPNVKGWDGGRAWINSSTLVGRANLIHQLLRDQNTRFAGGSLADFFQAHSGGDSEKFIDWFSEDFLAVPVSTTMRSELSNKLDGKSSQQKALELLSIMAALPQFQLS